MTELLLHIRFLIKCATTTTAPVCPCCGSVDCEIVDKKYLVLKLLKCKNCRLQYRRPHETIQENEAFYQEDYSIENTGITTDLPSPEQLEILKKDRFVSAGKNVDEYIAICNTLTDQKIRLIDYGANRGYQSYQFKQNGYEVEPYEISVGRAQYGENLGLKIKVHEEDISEGNTVFFSSHVLEHVPSVHAVIALARKKLTKDGYFIAETPNGSQAFREKYPHNFHVGWGMVHPNYLSDEYYKHVFRENPYYITSKPLDLERIKSRDKKTQIIDKVVDGGQLVVIAKINELSSKAGH